MSTTNSSLTLQGLVGVPKVIDRMFQNLNAGHAFLIGTGLTATLVAWKASGEFLLQ